MQEILATASASPSQQSGGSQGGGEASGHDNMGEGQEEWQRAADALTINEDDLRDVYFAAMEECKFDSAELEEIHTLAEKAQTTLDPRSPMVRAVLRDMRQLQEANLIHPDSAVFVRQASVVFYLMIFTYTDQPVAQ